MSIGIVRRLRTGVSFAAVVAASACLAACLAACGSSHNSVDTINPSQGTSIPAATSTVPSSSSTAGPGGQAAVVPTVFDCGGGAYEPTTLLVTCANAAKDATTLVTGVTWTSWSATRASGRGTVHLIVGGKTVTADASLKLSGVEQTSNGLQFATIEFTWIGTSPDGNPTEQLPLAVAPSAS